MESGESAALSQAREARRSVCREIGLSQNAEAIVQMKTTSGYCNRIGCPNKEKYRGYSVCRNKRWNV